MRTTAIRPELKSPLDEHPWPPQRKWTYEDYLRLPDDGWQYEIIKGELYMVPAPTTYHQRTSGNLGSRMWDFVQKYHLGEVFFAPTDVYLPGQETPVQPDLLFVAAKRTGIISERGIEGTPDLVVEIISPSTSWRDLKVKLPLYEETGVPECWIVDPKERTIEVQVLEGKSYILLGHWESGEAARSRVIEGFQAVVDEVMRT